MSTLEHEQSNKNPESDPGYMSDSVRNASSLGTENSPIDERAKPNAQEVGDRVKEKRSRNHVWYVRRCLDESFNLPDLQRFCHDNFDYVYKRYHDTGFDRIITEIIDYCSKHPFKFEILWEKIKEERLTGYKYYSDWKQVFKENEYEIILNDETQQIAQSIGNQPHALTTEDKATISEWFFKTLTRQEQGLVLTVALFEGINRRQMALIAEDLNRLLFDSTFNSTDK
jgi:hypothetical protein